MIRLGSCNNSCGAIHLIVGTKSNSEKVGPYVAGVSVPIPYNQLSFSSKRDMRLATEQLWKEKEEEKKA